MFLRSALKGTQSSWLVVKLDGIMTVVYLWEVKGLWIIYEGLLWLDVQDFCFWKSTGAGRKVIARESKVQEDLDRNTLLECWTGWVHLCFFHLSLDETARKNGKLIQACALPRSWLWTRSGAFGHKLFETGYWSSCQSFTLYTSKVAQKWKTKTSARTVQNIEYKPPIDIVHSIFRSQQLMLHCKIKPMILTLAFGSCVPFLGNHKHPKPGGPSPSLWTIRDTPDLRKVACLILRTPSSFVYSRLRALRIDE